MLGMLSPASRGALMTAAIFLYFFMGLVAGYYSARLYKTMKGTQWKRAAFLVSVVEWTDHRLWIQTGFKKCGVGTW
jgi:transmembrane 9 superfamily protein 2/4